ncbi:MAG: hypothetical protein AAFQ14_13085 [Cyanobacteria bacterium J06621_12]
MSSFQVSYVRDKSASDRLDVVELMEKKYIDQPHSWFGHPERQNDLRT